MTPIGQAARRVRQALLRLDHLPEPWRCRLCGQSDSPGEATPCEGSCGGWMHWKCYWPAMLTPTERTAVAAARQRDRQARKHRVPVKIEGRLYKLPASMIQSEVEDLLDHQVVLCQGCRS